MLLPIIPTEGRIASAERIPVIAVDFDGTLCQSRWPGIGPPICSTIRALKRRQDEGARLILWTCREGRLLDEAVRWCRQQGLQFDAINDNVPERIRQYGSNPRKVSADEYWDDKAVPIPNGTGGRY